MYACISKRECPFRNIWNIYLERRRIIENYETRVFSEFRVNDKHPKYPGTRYPDFFVETTKPNR